MGLVLFLSRFILYFRVSVSYTYNIHFSVLEGNTEKCFSEKYFSLFLEPPDMMFGQKLRSLRESKGWTQKQLADKAGTNQQSVGRWEAGEQVPGFDAVQSLCKAFGVSCNAFEDSTHGRVEVSRGRGRPKQPDAGPVPEAKAGGKRRKGKGA
jgi:DNA-binding XRE family transcriptional regulator